MIDAVQSGGKSGEVERAALLSMGAGLEGFARSGLIHAKKRLSKRCAEERGRLCPGLLRTPSTATIAMGLLEKGGDPARRMEQSRGILTIRDLAGYASSTRSRLTTAGASAQSFLSASVPHARERQADLRHTAASAASGVDHMAMAGTGVDEMSQCLKHSIRQIITSIHAGFNPAHLQKTAEFWIPAARAVSASSTKPGNTDF